MSAGIPAASEPLNAPAISAEEHARIDQLEAAMLTSDAAFAQLPLQHVFTPGIYTRVIFMPKGTLCTSKVHRVKHPYVVLSGEVSVFIPGSGTQRIIGPYFGTTEAGTRRVLYMHEDTVWITFHPNADDTEDLLALEERLIDRRELADGRTAYEWYRDLLAAARAEALLAPEDEPQQPCEPQNDYGGAP